MELNEIENEVKSLQEENRILRQWQQNVNQIMERMMSILTDQDSKLKQYEEEIIRLQYDVVINKGRISSLPYDLVDPGLKLPICRPRILSGIETIEKLVKEHKSFARFGDGEFGILAGVTRWRFQYANASLANRLLQVLQSNEEDLLIGLNPGFYSNYIMMPDDEALGYMTYMTHEVREQHKQLLDLNRTYADACCFRGLKTREDFQRITELWKDRKCLIIEGEHTGMGAGNDLLECCKDIKRIICPAENAYDKYSDILEAALQVDKDTLVLIALGPTATVLSYDLYKNGYQVVDVGHMDIQYEAVVRNSDIQTLVLADKYCTSDVVNGNRLINEINDVNYQTQIWKRIL